MYLGNSPDGAAGTVPGGLDAERDCVGECLALAANRGRCPLTPIAAGLTSERHQGFDIYLPGWVARWNKELFGSVFVAGMLFVLWREFG